MELSGRNVLLTGGSRGLGPVIAEALARRGANLALAARSDDQLERVCQGLRPLGVRAVPLAADLASPAERERLVERTRAELGDIDILVNNAGLENDGAFLDLAWDTVQQMVEVNLLAPLHLTHLVLPAMLDRSSGHVVQIASLAARVGMPYDAVYSGTKAGLMRWTEGLRREIEGRGVHLATIFPGYVTSTGMFARSGMRSPRLVGSCTPAQVATAVVRAVAADRADTVVNSLPLRPVLSLADMLPRAGDWAMKRIGLVDFQRRKADANAEQVG